MKKNLTISTKETQVKEENGKTEIRVPISSTNIDREGEKFSKQGLESLVKQINDENKPIKMFPDHGLGEGSAIYSFMDIMGEWVEGEIEEETAYADGILRENNKYADELKDLLSQDISVGFSIGFSFDEKDVEEMDNGNFVYNDADLMEISPVGVPSNADAQATAQVGFTRAVAKTFQENDIDLEKAVNSIKKAVKDLDQGEKDGDEDTPDEEENEPSEGEPEKSEMDLFVEGSETIANALDVEITEVFKLFVGKPFGPWEDFDDCVQDMMEEQGYDEETAEAVCAELQNELEGEGEDEDEDGEENGKMKQAIMDLKEENDKLMEEIKELKDEKQELGSELKKTRAKTRDSERKGMTPSGNDADDPNEPNEKKTYDSLTDEAQEFEGR